jgi:hypothetical protein
MASLAEIRAKLLAQQTNQTGNRSSGTGDNAIYAHWNIQEGENATLRFLPDADESNTFFWKERQMMRFEFPGVKGGDENKPVTVQVPCIEMWNETCPVHAEIRPWFKDSSMETLARKYWKKKSYIFQGFVTDNPINEDNTPENPIRRFVISPQIFKIISAALMDPDFPEIPTDYENGTDFKVSKGAKGGYADYGTSNWSRRERSLNQEERDAIAQHGLFNLNDYLPKKPSAEDLGAIFEMFEASVDGQLYDPERFANYYRPYGVDAPASGSGARPQSASPAPAAPVAAPAPAPSPAPAPAADYDVIPFKSNEEVARESAPAASGDAKPSAQDILAMIRNRKE